MKYLSTTKLGDVDSWQLFDKKPMEFLKIPAAWWHTPTKMTISKGKTERFYKFTTIIFLQGTLFAFGWSDFDMSVFVLGSEISQIGNPIPGAFETTKFESYFFKGRYYRWCWGFFGVFETKPTVSYSDISSRIDTSKILELFCLWNVVDGWGVQILGMIGKGLFFLDAWPRIVVEAGHQTGLIFLLAKASVAPETTMSRVETVRLWKWAFLPPTREAKSSPFATILQGWTCYKGVYLLEFKQMPVSTLITNICCQQCDGTFKKTVSWHFL